MMKWYYFLLCLPVCLAETELTRGRSDFEARGKFKYFALLSHIAHLVGTKVVILKIVYGVLFYLLGTKLWHFFIWFLHYVKKNKHVEYIDHDHDHEHHHEHHGWSEYGPPSYVKDHGPSYGSSYGPSGGSWDNGPYKRKVYDSDGSYSVNGGRRR